MSPFPGDSLPREGCPSLHVTLPPRVRGPGRARQGWGPLQKSPRGCFPGPVLRLPTGSRGATAPDNGVSVLRTPGSCSVYTAFNPWPGLAAPQAAAPAAQVPGSGVTSPCLSHPPGEHCEVSTRSGRCANGVCKNGGTCVNLLIGGFHCVCPPGEFERPYCEVTTRSFPPRSFVTFRGLRQRFHFTVSLT